MNGGLMMDNSIVRVKKISIKNFKNVVDGCLSLENTTKSYNTSVLGLYGQNGSGKTALIDAIALLKLALCGQTINPVYGDYINVDAKYAWFSFEFEVLNSNENSSYDVIYEFCIRKDVDHSSQNTDIPSNESEKYKVTLFDEKLKGSYKCGENKKKMVPIIDTCTKAVFGPMTKYKIFTGNKDTVTTDLLVAKKLAIATSKSFIFSRELLTIIRNNCTVKQYSFLLESLVWYGNYSLFVINTKNSGLISMNILPLTFKYEKDHRGVIGSFDLPLDEARAISKDSVRVVENVINSMNIVLTQLIPGLTISIKDLGTQMLKNNMLGSKIQLMSHKNGTEIALCYESDGIKKIISILQLLIVVYNKPSITVAIDELDAGIFEYLLGEILRIISEQGKGQLIFTSHNLRPLETLDRGFIAFTTTNPSNRYIRLSNIKSNNNLRDFYYRDIVLGEQDEPVYEPTNNYEIALAFREAGDISGS